MTRLITPDTISFRAHIDEAELKARLSHEVLDGIGALGPNGKPHPGIEVNVRRGAGRSGGYTIDITGPAPARLHLPPPEDTT